MQAQPWSVLALQVFPDSPQRELPFAPSLEVGHIPAGRSLQAPLSPDAFPSTMASDQPWHLIYLHIWFQTSTAKLGSRQCFQQDRATGCQVKNDLSCCKQTKQNSFQDVGLLFVWAGTWANTGMFQFEIASGVIAGTAFPNYIMSVFLGSDLGIVFGVKNIKSGTLQT